ncbi:MAG: glycosyl transferase [Rubellimicrobium sp.]|nr:glycosyl transferase [Rubellimicrobium sp.]
MTPVLGVVMLVHTAFDRAEQVIRHWVSGGCPVVVHVDANVPARVYAIFAARLSDLEMVKFSRRHRCEWGTWGIVAATQSAAELLLSSWPGLRNVYLASGACLPLRPIEELQDYLNDRPGTDFIESVTTADVHWTVGGLSEERFTLRFPFSWRRHRRLFDTYVRLQRRTGLVRKIPDGIDPHMGSQWWCLTRRTLTAILTDPDRPRLERYFRKVWIPDESYFQTLARRYSHRIESRSLTLTKFDFQGKPHIFYDDHIPLLRRSDCFVARKIWPRAEELYQAFLGPTSYGAQISEPNPGKIDRLFSKAVERRTKGRPGLYMQSRFPNEGWENGLTSSPYSVFQGFTELFEDFEPWLARTTGARVHGHLFAPTRVEFEDGQPVFAGGLSDSTALRDYHPRMFLTNLIWNTRGEHQCFQFGPRDSQKVIWDIAKDSHARVSVISGGWAVPLFRSDLDFAELRAEAARLQKIEAEHLNVLRSYYAKARIRIWSMAEFLEEPMENLQQVIAEIAAKGSVRIAEAPRLRDLSGFGQFLQQLRNQGMQPHLIGEFPVNPPSDTTAPPRRKPYLVR